MLYNMILPVSAALFATTTFGHALPPQVWSLKRQVNDQTGAELASILPNGTVILGPTDPRFGTERPRYMAQYEPEIQLSVRPFREEDVSTIVQFANERNIGFYAKNRGHSLTSSVAEFKGIEIDLRQLRGFQVNQDRQTARFQGGAFSAEVLPALWDQGLVTGTCSCVSILGPALGGGHGLQQGQHGLTMDHIVSMEVVLANGTSVHVDENTNTDLWWAMRGAGQNFGIVTSFTSKVWEDNFRDYFIRDYTFPSSVLEELVDEVNAFQGVGDLGPNWLGSFGLFSIIPDLSTTEATVSWIFLYDGTAAEAAPLLERFDRLQPIRSTDTLVPWKFINNMIGGGVDSPLCEGELTRIVGSAYLQTYNVTATRAIYDLFNENLAMHPEFSESRILLEGYAVEGVRSFPSDGSAYAHRDEYILTYVDATLRDPTDELRSAAALWRDQTVALWQNGEPDRPNATYLNYAAGFEPIEEIYGHDQWRLERLRDLKQTYDPENKFAFHIPIVPLV